jgi:hypothetical protein
MVRAGTGLPRLINFVTCTAARGRFLAGCRLWMEITGELTLSRPLAVGGQRRLCDIGPANRFETWVIPRRLQRPATTPLGQQIGEPDRIVDVGIALGDVAGVLRIARRRTFPWSWCSPNVHGHPKQKEVVDGNTRVAKVRHCVPQDVPRVGLRRTRIYRTINFLGGSGFFRTA